MDSTEQFLASSRRLIDESIVRVTDNFTGQGSEREFLQLSRSAIARSREQIERPLGSWIGWSSPEKPASAGLMTSHGRIGDMPL